MKKVFDELKSLDKRAIGDFFLSEDILMEHASLGLFNYIRKKFKKNKTILILQRVTSQEKNETASERAVSFFVVLNPVGAV